MKTYNLWLFCFYLLSFLTVVSCQNVTLHYYNHVYQIYTRVYTYSDAQQICENLGGYLVSINDENENTFALNAFLNTVRVVLGQTSDPHDQLTIGLSTDTCSLDDCRTGWRWEDGTDLTDSNFEFWGEGQPVNDGILTIGIFDVFFPTSSIQNVEERRPKL